MTSRFALALSLTVLASVATRSHGQQTGSSGATIKKPEIVTNSIGMKFALLPPGEFQMGSLPRDKGPDPDSESSEEPQHRVKLSGFRIGVTEVTVGQFRRYIKSTGTKTVAERKDEKLTWDKPGFEQTEEHPVVRVSWVDAIGFCSWLNKLEGESQFYKTENDELVVPNWSATGYRLPTEAEWEYACRAGTDGPFVCPPGELDRYAWFGDKSDGPAHAVGGKLPNAFGLYDMHGNVWEWCWDAYVPFGYKDSSLVDPRAAHNASPLQVVRGGSAHGPAKYCRSAERNAFGPLDGLSYCGFRVAATLPSR